VSWIDKMSFLTNADTFIDELHAHVEQLEVNANRLQSHGRAGTIQPLDWRRSWMCGWSDASRQRCASPHPEHLFEC
jgi:hypothetical protein